MFGFHGSVPVNEFVGVEQHLAEIDKCRGGRRFHGFGQNGRQRQLVSGGVFRPFALAGDRAVATWSVRDGEVVLEPFAPFDSAVARALEDDARDVARFLAT